jgi:hypothetical protein
MSKHHHYHPNHSGSFHTSTKKPHVDHHETDMILMMPSHHVGSNGIRQNGMVNGDVDSNDTNNNHNKHHAHHKRSAVGGGEASSSKRTKLSMPSDKPKVDNVRTQQSHYNIIEKLKELYKELKSDKSCKEVSSVVQHHPHSRLTFFSIASSICRRHRFSSTSSCLANVFTRSSSTCIRATKDIRSPSDPQLPHPHRPSPSIIAIIHRA